jgi:hypothetical protein
MRHAIDTKNATACAELPEPNLRAICSGMVTGTYACSETDASMVSQICRLLASGEKAKCDGTDHELCNGYWMAHGMTNRDASGCANLSGEMSARQCKAIALADPKLCSVSGTVPEHCRDVVFSTGVVTKRTPEGPRYAARLKAKNLHGEGVQCTALLAVRTGDGETTIEKDLGRLEPGDDIHSYAFDLDVEGGAPTLTASTRCRWDPPGAGLKADGRTPQIH